MDGGADVEGAVWMGKYPCMYEYIFSFCGVLVWPFLVVGGFGGGFIVYCLLIAWYLSERGMGER